MDTRGDLTAEEIKEKILGGIAQHYMIYRMATESDDVDAYGDDQVADMDHRPNYAVHIMVDFFTTSDAPSRVKAEAEIDAKMEELARVLESTEGPEWVLSFGMAGPVVVPLPQK